MSEPRLLHVGDLYALRPDLKPRWRVAAILNRGRSYDDVLLEHLIDPTLTSRARVYHPGLNPTDLTLPALVRLLDAAYRADQGTLPDAAKAGGCSPSGTARGRRTTCAA